MIDETLFDAEEKMEKAVSAAKDDLATLRTGRANPNMFGRIIIDYAGNEDLQRILEKLGVEA